MRKFSTQALLLLTAVLLIVFLATTAHAHVVSVRFFADGKLVQVNRSVPNNVPPHRQRFRLWLVAHLLKKWRLGYLRGFLAEQRSTN